MNDMSRWRRAIAERLAAIYARNPHIAAVVLGGSTARGHADQYSDIELGVFWNQPPTDKERRTVIELAGGDLIRLYPYEAQEEVWADDFIRPPLHMGAMGNEEIISSLPLLPESE